MALVTGYTVSIKGIALQSAVAAAAAATALHADIVHLHLACVLLKDDQQQQHPLQLKVPHCTCSC